MLKKTAPSCFQSEIWNGSFSLNHSHVLEHSVMDPDGDHEEDEHDDIPEDEERLRGHEVGEQRLREGVQLVTRADEDERGQEHVNDGIVGDQD